MARQFTPTPEMISAANAVFMAMAFSATIKPIVKGYQKKILEENYFTNKGELEKFSQRHPEIKEERITDPDLTYHMNDEDFKVYLSLLKKERDKAGLKVENDDFCPLLVAENMQRKAERVLIEVMQPITKINPNDLWKPEHYDKLVELTLKLLAPFVKSYHKGGK